MTKLLAVVVVAQVVLIALLYLSLSALERRVDLALQPVATGNTPSASQTAPGGMSVSTSGAQGVDSTMFRRIIREELRAAQWSDDTAPPAHLAAEPVFDEPDMQRRQDGIRDTLDYFKEQDEVSTAELDLLLAEIARLDPARRSEMLAELNRAMNRGEIKGKL